MTEAERAFEDWYGKNVTGFLPPYKSAWMAAWDAAIEAAAKLADERVGPPKAIRELRSEERNNVQR